MKKQISWKEKLPDGRRREVRVVVARGGLKWQFKYSDRPEWIYDHSPAEADWDVLEDILERRAGRGRAVERLDMVRTLRSRAGR